MLKRVLKNSHIKADTERGCRNEGSQDPRNVMRELVLTGAREAGREGEFLQAGLPQGSRRASRRIGPIFHVPFATKDSHAS